MRATHFDRMDARPPWLRAPLACIAFWWAKRLRRLSRELIDLGHVCEREGLALRERSLDRIRGRS